MGRWRADGRLEIRGRLDDQVSVRGYRVELGGVAAVLRGTPGISEAVVVKRGSDELVAYVTPVSQDALDPEALRAGLRRHADQLLPAYQRPSSYVVLRSMPLNRNGKINRAALPGPPVTRPDLSTAYVPVTQPDERRVAAIFAELLGVDQVGLYDDFIELGGDSLLAARAAHRISDEFGVDVPIRIVFDLSTVASLADWLATAPARGRQPVGSPGPDPDDRLPFTELQAAAWAHDLTSGRPVVSGPDFTLSVSYRIRGPINTGALSDAVDELVNRHPALRTSLHMRPDEGYQVIRSATTGLLRTAGPGTKLADALRSEPLEPASGRVFAADLIRDSNVTHTLSLRAHHMIADELSIHLIEHELTRLYEGFRTGRDPGLDAVPPYHAVIGQLAREANAVDLAYWAGKCRGAKPIELVPKERLEDATVGHRTHVSSLVVPAAEFLRLVRANRVTLHAALYAMTHALVAADTGAPEVLLHAVNAARRTVEQERTVGMFSDSVLVRQQVSPGLSFVDSIRRAADELNAAYRHANATTPALCQALPDMLAVMSQSQLVVFETLPPVTGLQLTDCCILRDEQGQDDYDGLEYQDPAGLNLLARQEGTALRLIVSYDIAFVPADYADRLLRRMRDVVITCGQDGDRAMDTVVSADPWLRAL